ncbi:MAG: CmcJ/NvfI family oxidoreductase [Alphaproteobacteria bacterium]
MNAAAGAVRTGSFNYMAATALPSLYRNGKVLTRRDRDGSDAEWQGVDLTPCEMPVRDARQLSGPKAKTLADNGFEMLARPLETPDLDFFDHHQVVRDYYPQCTAIIAEATGARRVAAFDHNVRSAAGKASKRRIEGGQQVQGPASVVHGDYTLTSAPQRLRDLTRPPGANDTLRAVLDDNESLLDADEVEQAIADGRFAIINLWRNIVAESVAIHPLALCDAASVRPDDLVVFEIHYADRVGENYFARHAEGHEWFFYPALTRDEALLIKQWDSAGRLARTQGETADAGGGAPCTFSFHSAFADPTTPADAPERWSIEVRCAVLYD